MKILALKTGFLTQDEPQLSCISMHIPWKNLSPPKNRTLIEEVPYPTIFIDVILSKTKNGFEPWC
jgi:hypothetical protein